MKANCLKCGKEVVVAGNGHYHCKSCGDKDIACTVCANHSGICSACKDGDYWKHEGEQ